MRVKFLKAISVGVLFIGLLGQANAGLILGGIYENSNGDKWKYVGSFDMAAGPKWDDADGKGNGVLVTPLNGQEAAASIFGLPVEDLALAAFEGMTQSLFDAIQEGQDVVNHLAWYDGNINAVRTLAEDIDADLDNDGNYERANKNTGSEIGDVSAYVNDRAEAYIQGGTDERFTYHINYVFEAAEVPEPSMLALFSLVLCGLGALRLKRHMLRPKNFYT
jgi:hypothetical protein